MAPHRTGQADSAKTGSDRDGADEHVRESVVRPFRARRENEPALAPFETDAEAGNYGGTYAGRAVPRDARGKPVDPVPETQGSGDPADVRIGPGDAGRQRKPRVLPERRQGRSDSWGRALAVIAVTFVIVLVIGLLV
ncbi:hypothetical protein DLJ49_17480 [Rhodovulum sp. 12E13]|uniref:hypothetical protein n=1 Tax=Rhodovulum sp. 12E13 TaxID=2203891 RepID=UPI000E19950D|nr:hypothetical protein [Rhodovulum sp. 12E13]RDC69936.1 hypothetical protein DLJ49_17480 [Rhodovulum sp. 12E13]